MDANENPVPNIVLHPGDRIYYSRHDNGAVEYGLADRNGDRYATLRGHPHPDHPGDFVIDTIEFDGGRLLPVRPESLSNSITLKADPYTYLGDPPAYAHFHRHPHTKPDDALTIDYWHKHPHAHPDDDTAPHVPERDGDAALHDPGPGHGHDERGDDTKPGYPGAVG